MKHYKLITVITVILAIIAIISISFFGLYKQKEYKVVNTIPNYKLGMEFSGGVTLRFELDTSKTTKVYDSEGNEVAIEEGKEYPEDEGYKTVEEKVNKDEILTKQNFEKTKKILSKRLGSLGATQYDIRQDQNTGDIRIDLPDDENTEHIISALVQNGKFEVKDDATQEVLMNNSDILKASVVYGQATEGTSVYLQIKFNKEGTKKLEEISKTYIATTDEEGKETTKKISIVYDDTPIKTTYFGDTMPNGILNILINTSSDNNEVLDYAREGNTMAITLNTGVIPIKYNPTSEDFTSNIDQGNLKIYLYALMAIVLLSTIVLIVIFKLKGIYGSILHIGYIGTLLLIIRLTNVILTIEGIMGIILWIAINYMVIYMLLNSIVKNKREINVAFLEIAKKMSLILIPIYIIAIIFSFGTSSNLSSLGMTLVWGAMLIYIYNLIFTYILLNVVKRRDKIC